MTQSHIEPSKTCSKSFNNQPPENKLTSPNLKRACAIAAILLLSLVSGPPANAKIYLPEKCVVSTQVATFAHCQTDTKGKYSVAVIGDSHARSWFEPMRLLAARYSWKLTVISKSACPILDPGAMPSRIPSPTCASWNRSLQHYLATQPAFDLVINSSSSLVTHGYKSYAQSFRAAVPAITRTGAQLLVIRDNPKPATGFQACIKQNAKTAAIECSRPRAEALTPNDPMPAAVADLAGVKVVDFTDAFCGQKVCSPVLNGILVYKDHSHMSKAFARHLTSVLEAAIPAKLKK